MNSQKEYWKTLTELSLFTGGGGGLIATSLFMGIKTIGMVEWNENCHKILQQRQKDNMLDQCPIFGDIQKFISEGYAEAYKGLVDIITGGFPCFTKGNLVLTSEGYKEIQDVRIGDFVLTHKGRYRKVLRTMQKSGADTRYIKGHGFDSIEGTKEHPFYTRKRGKSKGKRIFDAPKWTEFLELQKDTFCSQVIPTNCIDYEYSENLLWIMGRYVADGHRVRRKNRSEGSGRIVISVGKHKSEELEERIKSEFGTCTKGNERTSTRFHIVRNEIYQFSSQFGSKAKNKQIPGWIFSLPKRKVKAFLEGYLSGDGSKTKNGWRASTISKKLAYGIALLHQIVNNSIAGIRIVKTPETCVIEGRTVNSNDYYVIDLPNKNRTAFTEFNYGWKQIQYNKEGGKNKTVHNLEVEDDNSYTVNNVIVHNCQPFSTSGLRKAEEDKRNMWPSTKETIRIIQPQFLFLENVSNLLSFPYIQSIFGQLAKIGYDAKWTVLSAKDIGAFHKRDRLWIFGEKSDNSNS